MLMGKRIGKWSWALSAEERLTAVLVDQAHGDNSRLSIKLKRAHDGMVEKQRKLAARER